MLLRWENSDRKIILFRWENHFRENPDHTIDFYNPLILAQETNWRKLRIKKTLYIQKLQPQLNSDKASHPLYLFNV